MDPGIMATYQFEIFADYHQVCLQDCGLREEESEDPLERAEQIADRVVRLVGPEAQARHLGVTDRVICILTAQYSNVPVTLEIRNMPPQLDIAAWDHVVEASLAVPSGCLVIHGPTELYADAAQIQVNPGIYRARVHVEGLDTVSADDRDGEDHYRVVLWPAPFTQPIVLKSAVNW